MKKITMIAAAVCIGLLTVGFNGGEVKAAEKDQVVTRGNQAAYDGPVEFFTGKVIVQPVFGDYEGAPYSGGYVTFAPGARSAWHTHPAGQRLLVVKGTCWTKTWDGRKTVAHAGDSIWCPENVKHWHGASPNEEMTHLALTNVDSEGNNVTWLEKVSDEQYYSE